ncbi:MAG: hypothetical protein CMI01_00255 [Oceanospirillaceae bacterium]|nr:hypothetical protein [Oceanospirillaceae bacterium]MBS97098.1 hypothetical protein [Oceanospirillaceae bacterium]|tara:strand:+ start:62 stop:814 length:753 start_codon:yes stop_codon:yes gene_type:complete
MLKIEFDANNLSLAAAIGAALIQYGAGESRQIGKKAELAAPYETETTPGSNPPEKSLIEKVHDVLEKTEDVKHAKSDGDFSKETVNTAAAFGAKTEETAPANDGPVDEHGTPHNEKFCVSTKSQKPFYASGANKGQWKKKPGVDENAYNEWYAATMPLDGDEPKESTPVDTASAFGGKTEQTAPAAGGDVPQNAGDLMEYVSERQAAGTLDQKLVTAAYGEVGVEINDLFGPKEAEAVAKLYAHLKTISL